MPYKSKEKAWLYFVLSIIAFWFKGGIVFIIILWTIFFIIDLPRDLKELERYNRYLEQQNKAKSKNDSCNKDNDTASKIKPYSGNEEKICQRNKEIYTELRKAVDDMNAKLK